ncbi:hypothetical protein HOP52_02395 [Halomonas campisalis]|uniref:Uncharacterized protein n=1 Tax=Billgrantia campisalis TaxID=74661 RepID=A0ABS9P5D0_9GAMM|nr:hypothetical protein [Halomonas campisalis]MCG6656624.1 hypothetical protein [Halomonas campisalis]MDR5861812.1 hypothetical protein [Halomonas campisalis]
MKAIIERVPSSQAPGSQRHPGWRRWAVSLLLVGLLMLLAFHQSHRLQPSDRQAPLFRVVVGGEALTLDAETHAAFGRDLAEFTADFDAQLVAELTPWMAPRLEAAFAPLEAAVPGYLDWYFSLRGSYLRLGMAIAGDLDGWLEARLRERLIEQSGIESALDELQVDFSARLAQAQQASLETLEQRLHARYAERQVSPESAESGYVIDLGGVFHEAIRESLDRLRWSTAGVGGAAGLVAGRALTQRLAGGAAAQSARVALGRVAARLGTHASRSLASGATAGAVAAPTGPGALVAGSAAVAVSLAAFAATEYALLKAEEARYRPAMEEELLGEVERVREELGEALEARAAAATTTLVASLERLARQAEAQAEVPDEYRIFGRETR